MGFLNLLCSVDIFVSFSLSGIAVNKLTVATRIDHYKQQHLNIFFWFNNNVCPGWFSVLFFSKGSIPKDSYWGAKARRRQQWESHQIKALMSKTNLCTFLCRSLQNNNVKWQSPASSTKCWQQWIIFRISWLAYLTGLDNREFCLRNINYFFTRRRTRLCHLWCLSSLL